MNKVYAFSRTSTLTGKHNSKTIQMTPDQFGRVTQRESTKELIQDILPDHSVSDREFLISGTTDEEWELLKE